MSRAVIGLMSFFFFLQRWALANQGCVSFLLPAGKASRRRTETTLVPANSGSRCITRTDLDSGMCATSMPRAAAAHSQFERLVVGPPATFIWAQDKFAAVEARSRSNLACSHVTQRCELTRITGSSRKLQPESIHEQAIAGRPRRDPTHACPRQS